MKNLLKEGAILDGGRYLMRFHIEPIGGGKWMSTMSLTSIRGSVNGTTKMEEIRKEMKEFHLLSWQGITQIHNMKHYQGGAKKRI